MPYIKLQPTIYQQYSGQYSKDYRTAIYKTAKNWSKRLEIEVADIYTEANKIIAKPDKYGFNASLIDTPCYAGNYHVFNAPVCDKPDTHFFWDHVHPSAAAIRLLTGEFLKAFEKL